MGKLDAGTIGTILGCIMWTLIFIYCHIQRKKVKIKNIKLVSTIDDAITESGLVIDDWENIKATCLSYPWYGRPKMEYTQGIAIRINRIIHFTLKYTNLSHTDLDLLIDGKYFINMTEEMVIESVGRPTRIEEEVMKTKTKNTYIYGNKSSGDVLVFEEGKLVRFKDR